MGRGREVQRRGVRGESSGIINVMGASWGIHTISVKSSRVLVETERERRNVEI